MIVAIITAVLVTLAVGPCYVAWEDAGCPRLEEL